MAHQVCSRYTGLCLTAKCSIGSCNVPAWRANTSTEKPLAAAGAKVMPYETVKLQERCRGLFDVCMMSPRAVCLPDEKNPVPAVLVVPSAGLVDIDPKLNMDVPDVVVPGFTAATFAEPALGASVTASFPARAMALNARRCLQQPSQHPTV